jgi:hypothetical protein
VTDLSETPVRGNRGGASQKNDTIGLAQLGEKFPLPIATRRDTVSRIKVEKQGGKALDPESLRNTLSLVPVVAAVTNKQRCHLPAHV